MKINASPWFHALTAAIGAALPFVATQLPHQAWLWAILGMMVGGTAFQKAAS